jgi:hypothetical protein
MPFLFLKQIIKEKVRQNKWNLLTIKYLFSGGTFALCALLTGKSSDLNVRYKSIVNIVSILAASLLIGRN